MIIIIALILLYSTSIGSMVSIDPGQTTNDTGIRDTETVERREDVPTADDDSDASDEMSDSNSDDAVAVENIKTTRQPVSGRNAPVTAARGAGAEVTSQRAARKRDLAQAPINVVRGEAAIERERQKRLKRRTEMRLQREREHALVSRKVVEEPEPEMAKKRRDASELVDRAVDFFKNNDLFTAVQALAKSPAWRKGEIFVFVFSVDDGICWTHGDDYELLWNDITKITSPSATGFVYASYRDVYGEKILQAMVAAANRDGWISHLWNNSIKLSYVQNVVKDGKNFILGAGFYPSSIDFATENLVKRAVSALEEDPDAPVTISNPNGLFVEGDLAVSVYNMQGDVIAHGISQTYIGQNRLNLKDSDGVYIIRELIKKIEDGQNQGFMFARWDGLPVKIYYQKATLPRTRESLLVMSYYYMEETGKRNLKAFLAQAVRYLEANGREKAFNYFSKKRGHFVVAGMHIEAYDLKGNCLANGESPEFVGQNFWNKRDSAGNLIIKNLIEDVQKTGTVTKSSYNKAARKLYYAELVKVPDGTYVIAACLYLHSKPGEVQYLVKDGVSRLKAVGPSKSLYKFTDRATDFFRGDLSLAVYDSKGVCLANGNNKTLIWQNLSAIKDEQGRPILERVLAEAEGGGGWIRYRYRNTDRLVYSKAVDAPINERGDLVRLIVASGYYL